MHEFSFEKTVWLKYRLLFGKIYDSQLIFLRFQNPVPGIWQNRVSLFRSGGFSYLASVRSSVRRSLFSESNPDTTLADREPADPAAMTINLL